MVTPEKTGGQAQRISIEPLAENRPPPARRVSVVRTMDDLMRAASVRSIVYMGDQDCPFAEEFDGNDFCAMHILGWIGDEAASCLRVRFFANFAKLERLAVLPRFRRSTIAFETVRFALKLIARKGYAKAYGHAREGLEPFWARFGAYQVGPPGAFAISGRRYTEMSVDLEPAKDAICMGTDPLVILRPEGVWDEPGVLEHGTLPKENPPARQDAADESAWSTNAQVAWLRWAGRAMAAHVVPRNSGDSFLQL
jgi:predicted GNAT family N-acyltransferase